MKEIVFSFILYMIYDAYMRQRDKDKYVTQSQLSAATSGAKVAALPSTINADFSDLSWRISELEEIVRTSPYA
jgi:hypothetical protein